MRFHHSENGIDKRRRHEIPLVSINSSVLAKIVRFLEYYKREPSEIVMCFGLICYSRRESVEHILTIKMIVLNANNHPALYIFKNWRHYSGGVCTDG